MQARHSHGRRPIKDERKETSLFHGRVLFGGILILLVLTGLLARYFWLQVVRHEDFSTQARQNRVQLRHLPPARGLIFDRNGVLLADNLPAFRLEVIPERVDDLDAMLDRLADVVPLSERDRRLFLEQVAAHRDFQSLPLKFDLSEAERARFALESWRFPGAHIVPYLTRFYPRGSDFAHVIGYVGRIDENDLAGRDVEQYVATSHIGKIGIEHHYEERLHGQPGYELVEVNATQRPLRVLERHPPVSGSNLYLTIDARLQRVAMEAFGEHAGGVVAIDPRNGEVLVMASKPGFDPNLFVNGISQADYSALLANPQKPFLHRALRGLYPPGSTVKPFLGLGGLLLNLREPEDSIVSTGVWHLPGQERGYRDDRRWGHGRVNLREAIEQSVNTYFYALANDMGIDRLAGFMSRFGFGKPTGIDLDDEASGILPSREWKRANRSLPWYPGETVISGIGQGFWAVTPLQLAHAVAIMAMRGDAHQPHLVAAVDPAQSDKHAVAQALPTHPLADALPEQWQVVHQGMLDVVYGEGTARGLGEGLPFLVAGKTGTAERYSRTTDAYHPNRTTEELAARHRALFICFAPATNPRIAIAVIVDEGAWGGSTAAPIARKILLAWAKDLSPAYLASLHPERRE